MEPGPKRVFEFGRFQLDGAAQVLHRNGKRLPLAPKLLELLVLLVENHGQIVAKDQILQKVWPDAFVEETSLTRNISLLRKLLEDDRNGHAVIETVPKRGYVFSADVREVVQGGAPRALQATNKSARLLRACKVPGAALVVTILALALGTRVHTVHGVLTPPLSQQFGRRQLEFQRLTTTGNVQVAGVSGDGRYIAYVAETNGQQAIDVLQSATRSVIAITNPTATVCCSLSFSPDDDYIYYVASPNRDDTYRNLYRMPLLGGVARTVARDVDSPAGISPDGGEAAFRRYLPNSGRSLLVITRVADGQERVLTQRESPEFYLGAPAWSPDGREIAICIGSMRSLQSKIAIIASGGGVERQIISEDKLQFERLTWLPDSSGWIVAASDPQGTTQLWLLSRKGQLRRITHDLSSYSSLGLSRDSQSLVAIERQTSAELWIRSLRKQGESRRITSTVNIDPDATQMVWNREGKLVFSSRASGDADIWSMGPDGTDPRQLTTGAGADDSPAWSRDGRRMVFVSARDGGSNVWSMETDRGSLKRLTWGNSDFAPQISRDGQWVIFYSRRTGKPTLWKIPTAGGKEVQIRAEYGICPSISPDGTLIAYGNLGSSQPMHVEVMPFGGGKVVKSFAIANPCTLSWAPDGKGLTYIASEETGATVWLQPLNKNAPSVIDVESTPIGAYAFSPDGNKIAVALRHTISDLVLLRLR